METVAMGISPLLFLRRCCKGWRKRSIKAEKPPQPGKADDPEMQEEPLAGIPEGTAGMYKGRH